MKDIDLSLIHIYRGLFTEYAAMLLDGFRGICESCGLYSDVRDEFSGADRVYNQ